MSGSDIYLDNAATTPVAPDVAAAVQRALVDVYGNPSSVHSKGVAAEAVVKHARQAVANALDCTAEEIVFTSGGTEGNNLAILGAGRARRRRGRHIITTAIEHSSVLGACAQLETEGFDITYLPVAPNGTVHPDRIVAALRDDTVLVSTFWINNEIGSINPVADIARAVKTAKPDVLFHTDAVQAFAKVPVHLRQAPIDLLTLSGHKIHAPKGIGALFIRRNLHLTPLVQGGGQEGGLRPGTENTPGIAGLDTALRFVLPIMAQTAERLQVVKTQIIDGLSQLDGFRVNGAVASEEGDREKQAAGSWTIPGAPHIVNVSFAGVKGEVLVRALTAKGVYVSTGSACSSKKTAVSHVLEALDLPSWALDGSIRISPSAQTDEDAVHRAVDAIKDTVADLRRKVRWKGMS